MYFKKAARAFHHAQPSYLSDGNGIPDVQTGLKVSKSQSPKNFDVARWKIGTQ
jgi:hypothetical protein